MKIETAKKISKKSLSVILAVIMMLSTCSVCFGLDVFAANRTTYAWQPHDIYTDPFQELAAKLEENTELLEKFKANSDSSSSEFANKKEGIWYTTEATNDSTAVNNTYIYVGDYADYIAMNEIIELVYYVADYCQFVGVDDKELEWGYNSSVSNDGTDRRAYGENMNSTYDTIVARLPDYFVNPDFSGYYNTGKLIEVIFNPWSGTQNVYQKNYDSSGISCGHTGIPNELQANVYVQHFDLRGWIEYNGGENYLNITDRTCHTVKMHYKTSYDGKRASCYLFADDGDIIGNTVEENVGWGTGLVSMVNAYKADLAQAQIDFPEFENVYDLYKSDSPAVVNYLATLDVSRNTLLSYVGDSDSETEDETLLLESMVGQELEDVHRNFVVMDDIAKYEDIGTKWKDYQDTNKEYGVFNSLGFEDGVKLAEDFEYFTTNIYEVLHSSTQALADFFMEEYGLSEEYYTNFKDNVSAYKANEIKTALDKIYDEYVDADLETIDAEIQSTVYTALDSYLTTLEAFSAQVIKAENIFNNDLSKYYDLEAKFECELNEAVKFFVEYGTANYANYKTSELLGIFSKEEADADGNIPPSIFELRYSELEALNEKLTETAGEETAAALLTPIYEYATPLQFNIYEFLGSRFEGQVAHAMAYYDTLSNEDGTLKDDVVIDAKLYMNLKTSVGAIDASIYETFTADLTYDKYVDVQTQSDYAILLANIIPKLEEVGANLGFDVYQQTEVEYADRNFYEGIDKVKDETTPYEVESENLKELITTIDSLLKDEEILALVKDLLGVDLTEGISEMVKSLLVDNLFTDDIVNTVVGLVYPLVADNFNIALPATVEYSGIDIKISYEYRLPEVVLFGELAIEPQGLATLINKEAYPDAYALLTQAGEHWDARCLLDESGKLAINWGVDEACAIIDAAIADGSYDESIHGTKYDVFVNAMGNGLEGLFPLLKALLLGQSWMGDKDNIATAKASIISLNINLDIGASANDGYVNFIGAIFESLGFYNYQTAEWISNNIKNATQMVDMLFTDVFNLLDYLLDSPIENILNAIPNLVYALMFDMIPELLGLLKTTVAYTAEATMGEIKIEAMKDAIPINLGEMLNLADMGLDTSQGLNGILGLLGVELETLDTGLLGTCGELEAYLTKRTEVIYEIADSHAYRIVADTEGVLYYILTYVIDAIKTGEFYKILGAFMDDTSSIEEFITKNLGFAKEYVSSGDVIAAICELFEPYFYGNAEYFTLDAIVHDVDTYVDADGVEQEIPDGYIYDEATGTLVEGENSIYTEYWTEEKAEFITGDLPEFVLEISTLLGYDLEALLTSTVDDLLVSLYTMDNLQSLLDLIAPYIAMVNEDETISMIVETAAPFIDELEVLAIVEHLSTFELNSFEDGDRDAFVSEIVRFVAPLVPVLKLFLLDDSGISVYDETISVNSYDGYTSAILPIFEALGCSADDMVTPTELAAIEDNSEFVNAILKPILGLLDSVVSDDLIYKVLEIAPNILYFIEQGGLNLAINNLLRPVYVVLDTIRPIYNVNLSVNIDLTSILDDLLASIKIEGFALPSFMDLIEAIMTIGETVEKTSVSGDVYNYVVISEDSYPDLLTVVLYELVEGITIMENIDPYINIVAALTDFLPESETLDEMKQLLTAFSELESPDQVLFVLYYVVYGVEVGVDTFEDARDLVTEQIEEVFELIGGFSSDTYGEIAGATSDLLDDLAGQLGDLGIDPEITEPTLNFFQKILKAIQDFFAMIGDWFKV